MQTFVDKFLLKWRIKWRSFEFSVSSLNDFYLKVKNISFESRFILFLFFSNSHIHNFVLILPNVVKIDVETTLSNVVQINVEIDNVDSMLFNVVSSNVDVHKVVTTFIWRCVMSRRDINLKITLKQRLNVLQYRN